MYAVERHHTLLHMSGLKLLCWIAMFYWQLLLAEQMCLLMSCLGVYLITERLPTGSTLCGSMGIWGGATTKYHNSFVHCVEDQKPLPST